VTGNAAGACTGALGPCSRRIDRCRSSSRGCPLPPDCHGQVAQLSRLSAQVDGPRLITSGETVPSDSAISGIAVYISFSPFGDSGRPTIGRAVALAA